MAFVGLNAVFMMMSYSIERIAILVECKNLFFLKLINDGLQSDEY
jgi:hypothetical protein